MTAVKTFRIAVTTILAIVAGTSIVEPCEDLGCVDESFGASGVVAVDFAFGEADRGNAVVRVPGDDRIFVIGQVSTAIAGDDDFGVACLLGDGSACPTFGILGQTTVAMDFVAEGLDAAIDGAVIPWPGTDEWRLAVVGQVERSTPGDIDFGVALIRPDGSLESDASGGKVAVAFDLGGSYADVPAAVVATADGKILVGGTIDVAGDDSDWGFVRLNADLTPDLSFGTNSKAVLDVAGLSAMNAMLLQPDGKIIAVGRRDFGVNQMVIARLNADGSPDITFGLLGQTVFEFGGPGPQSDVAAWDVAADSQGRLVLVGGTEAPATLCAFSARVLPNGQPDNSYSDGSATEAMCLSQTQVAARAVEVLPDGLIVMVLEYDQTGHDFAILFREPDTGVGAILAVYPLDLGGANDDRPRSVLIRPDGKIVVAGRTVGPGGTLDFGVLRVWTDLIFTDGFESGNPIEWGE
jgi:uncharacterized delta-60 repeat protein